MTVEAASYPPDLDITLPNVADFLVEGPTHIKLNKAVLKNTLPNVAGAVNATHTELNLLVGATGVIKTTTTPPAAGDWVHMASNTITSLVTAIDFVNGVGNIIIGPTYDQYRLVIIGLGPAALTKSVQLLVTTNAGTSWEVSGFNSQYQRMTAGVHTVGQTAAAGYFPVTAEQTIASVGSASLGLYATVDLLMHPGNANMVAMKSEFSWDNGGRCGIVHGKSEQASDINGFRLRLNDASNINNNGAVVRFYGRKT